MTENLQIGDRVKVLLESDYWSSSGWFDGTVVKIQPYSKNRSFYWVELDVEVQPAGGGVTRLLSILNPRNIVRV